MATLVIREFTDPACPFAFSAEPARWRLRWLCGDAIEWQPRLVVLSQTPDEYTAKGFTPERQSAALEQIQRRYGMPIDPRERPRMLATVHACRAVASARVHTPDREHALLRRLRIRAMAGDMIDEPGVIALAAREAGIDPFALFASWQNDAAVEEVLAGDMAAARAPSRSSRALDHKLAAAGEGRRYTCPSYEIERLDTGARLDAPGFQPVEVYEALIANLAPELPRRDAPDSVADVLAWAGEPLATAEVAAICGETLEATRTELARVAAEDAVGPDGWWTLRPAAGRVAA